MKINDHDMFYSSDAIHLVYSPIYHNTLTKELKYTPGYFDKIEQRETGHKRVAEQAAYYEPSSKRKPITTANGISKSP